MHLKQGKILKIRSFFHYHRRFGCEHAALPIAKREGLIVDLGNSDDCAVFFCVKPEDTHEHSIYVIWAMALSFYPYNSPGLSNLKILSEHIM